MIHLLLLLLPLTTALLIAVWGRSNASWCASKAIVATAVGLGLSVVAANVPQSWHYQWAGINIALMADKYAILMLVLIYLIALLVQIFSVSYMKHDMAQWRYFAYLQLFIFAMVGLVMANNLVMMYVFWELVGLASYLLIGFWYNKPRASWAAKKAFLFNRVGDVGFLIGILLLVNFDQTLIYFTNHTPQTTHLTSDVSTLIALCLFMGCMGKSAQWPLSGWLPDAMEGPTPVSALIHAATMVAAGIFMLVRIQHLVTPDAAQVMACVGTITMLYGGYHAVFQNDIKKVLAYSTVSQLGLMVLGLSMGAVQESMFHLTTHAFFKAGLFLCAGAVIHALHTQNMRQMGGVRHTMPLIFWIYTACAAALIGLPFSSGFLSKDSLLIALAQQEKNRGFVVLCLLSTALTAFYTMRQWKMVFLGVTKQAAVDADIWIKIALLPLGFGALFIGFSVNPFDATHGWFFDIFGSTLTNNHQTWVVWLSLLSIFVGLVSGFVFGDKINVDSKWNIALVYDYFTDKIVPNITKQIAQGLYIFDSQVIDRTVRGFSYLTVIVAHLIGRFDRLVVDGFVNLMTQIAYFLGNRIRNLQNGQIQHYFVVALIGLLGLLYFFVF